MVDPRGHTQVDYFVVCAGLSDANVRHELERFSSAFSKQFGRLPSFWIHDMCGSGGSVDYRFLPVFAAGCDKALVLVSNRLLRVPSGVLQLFAAMAVHCEPERVRRLQQIFLEGFVLLENNFLSASL